MLMSRKSAAILGLTFFVMPVFMVWVLALGLLTPVVNQYLHNGEYGKLLAMLLLGAVGSMLLANRFYRPVQKMWNAINID
jgi:hypothetical protein